MADHAILIHFQYGRPDLSELLELEDQLEQALSPEVGQLDGNDVATDRTEGTLFLYGSDADAVWKAVEPTIRACPFMKGAEVLLRYGPPEDGVADRQFTL